MCDGLDVICEILTEVLDEFILSQTSVILSVYLPDNLSCLDFHLCLLLCLGEFLLTFDQAVCSIKCYSMKVIINKYSYAYKCLKFLIG